jgi:hypothetical protein
VRLTPSQLDLVASAHALRAAAVADDVDGVHSELASLRTALLEHLQHRAEDLTSLSEPVRLVVVDGQRRVLALLNDLLLGPRADEDGCCCLLRAAEVELAVRRQARLEASVLRPRPQPPATE